ncbi:MAG: hypothetical protein P9L92_19730 [Candidatus Electryonea clarkiae]|nr:hypothetical protein [Candidatus Electryonea clarkiae]MDP8287232.1 hypothetical protein [Candidatus Electryonea clarkiae]
MMSISPSSSKSAALMQSAPLKLFPIIYGVKSPSPSFSYHLSELDVLAAPRISKSSSPSISSA